MHIFKYPITIKLCTFSLVAAACIALVLTSTGASAQSTEPKRFVATATLAPSQTIIFDSRMFQLQDTGLVKTCKLNQQGNVTSNCVDNSSAALVGFLQAGLLQSILSAQNGHVSATNATNGKIDVLSQKIDALASELEELTQSANATMGAALVEQFRALPLAMIENPQFREELRELIAAEIMVHDSWPNALHFGA